MSLSGEQRTVGAGKSRSPAAKACFQNPILLMEIVDAVEQTAVDPAAEQEQLEYTG
jgi:hypothetical protein